MVLRIFEGGGGEVEVASQFSFELSNQKCFRKSMTPCMMFCVRGRDEVFLSVPAWRIRKGKVSLKKLYVNQSFN